VRTATMADAPGFLHSITGSFAQPAAENPTVEMIEAAYRQRGWTLPQSIDRVYVIDKAVEQLGYCPRFNFTELLATLA